MDPEEEDRFVAELQIYGTIVCRTDGTFVGWDIPSEELPRVKGWKAFYEKTNGANHLGRHAIRGEYPIPKTTIGSCFTRHIKQDNPEEFIYKPSDPKDKYLMPVVHLNTNGQTTKRAREFYRSKHPSKRSGLKPVEGVMPIEPDDLVITTRREWYILTGGWTDLCRGEPTYRWPE